MTLDIEGVHHHQAYETGETLLGEFGLPAIEFRNVDLAFDDQVILDKISFTVRRGKPR
ncbi:MAG: hypothetical protein IPK98_08275 [Chloracidobacterium sp.]|nr:hypothetical protein [Chloracidobacterium sp.]